MGFPEALLPGMVLHATYPRHLLPLLPGSTAGVSQPAHLLWEPTLPFHGPWFWPDGSVRHHPLHDLRGTHPVWRHHGISINQCRAIPTLHSFRPRTHVDVVAWTETEVLRDHTTFGPARFASSITWQRLLTLYLGNLALLFVTLGFAWPWVTVRSARFFTSTLSLEGSVNLDRILQETTTSSVTGEGLSNLLDTGFDMN